MRTVLRISSSVSICNHFNSTPHAVSEMEKKNMKEAKIELWEEDIMKRAVSAVRSKKL